MMGHLSQYTEASPADSLVQLEFDKIIAFLAGFTQTAYGYEKATLLRPLTDLSTIESALQEAGEAQRLIEDSGPMPVGSGKDLRGTLQRLKTEGMRLDTEDLRDVQAAVEAAMACRRRIADCHDSPLLSAHARALALLPDLGTAIRRSIGPGGEILDTASPALAELRQKLKQERVRTKRQLESMLSDESLQGVFQDTLITERNGRYVLPVRTDHSGRLKGFVHDVSATGQTLFMEPSAALDGNNRIQRLLRDVQHEENRVLENLSQSVRQVRSDLLANQEILAHLDLRQAIARMAAALDAVVPELAKQPMLSIKAARHPLLALTKSRHQDPDQKTAEIIPVDLRLDHDQSVLIVSGPNTGGKTVSLKTAALLVLMARAGLPIPCAQGSQLFPFAPVLADIGDEQSIEQSLSTFSGHLTRLKRILTVAGRNTLVVLDELGTGTDPVEGAALALATLDQLRQAGSRVLATTHLHVIKGYAQLEEGVVNAAVEFDEDTLLPTYRLHYGIPGASQAFTIAERLGLPAGLLDKAEEYLGHGEREGMAIIERLQALRIALEQELNTADLLRQEAEEELSQQQKLKREIEGRRQAILDETRQEGSRLLAQAEAQLRELFQKAKPDRAKAKDRAEMTRSIRSIRQRLPAAKPQGPETVPSNVAVGEILFVPSLGVDVEVLRVVGQEAELNLGGKRLRQKLDSLRQYQPRRHVKPVQTQPRIRDQVPRQPFRPRLVIVGKRADEAQNLIDRFLDEAQLHNARRIEIVHGAGQGILRRMVRELLAERPDVLGFQAADMAEGGENITVVDLQN
ncbi:MAG: endonuclease MutS2 [Deltaproteobacteria bacterium]|jgi:DNA mismatch repair protein MutS2|nr:endonuclease MutS2 [Deltaproteobacteria bacterium]